MSKSSSSLTDYLAKNYLSADPSSSDQKKKKKKRKAADSSNLLIADDDAQTWSSNKPTDNDDEDTPVVSGHTSAFRKTKASNWKRIDEDAEAAAADAIIAANTDARARGEAEDDAPAVVDAEGMIKLDSGAHAGLQSAEQVAAQIEAQRAAERRAFEKMDPKLSGKGQDTIYRDASGRVINVAMARAEARKALEEEERKKAAVKELQKGDVQRRLEEQRRKELADAKYMPFARHKDDEEMNQELREKEVWNDPAATFLDSRKLGGGKRGKKVYQGPSEPNRFGIRPGYRWDGVDRGNGFEKKWFQAQNRKREVEERKYTTMMDID